MRVLSTITARQYADLFTPCRNHFRDVLDEWSFPCAAGSDVSDADYRTIEFGGLKRPTAI
jgi:hypothetical protein